VVKCLLHSKYGITVMCAMVGFRLSYIFDFVPRHRINLLFSSTLARMPSFSVTSSCDIVKEGSVATLHSTNGNQVVSYGVGGDGEA
jgi:hypothetical protein